MVLVNQYNLKNGQQLSGDRADDAIMKELDQVDELETFAPEMAKDLSAEDKRKALESLVLISEKRTGEIKGRIVVNGSKQRTYDGYEKTDGSSPTVTTDIIFLTGLIEAKE